MLYALVILNLAFALALVLAIWRSDLYRASWHAHLLTLLLAIVFFLAAAYVSYRAEVGRSIMFGHYARLILMAFCYLPFLAFLVVAYLRAILSSNDDASSTSSYVRADHYAASGQYRKAARAYRRELARNPDNVDVRLKLAETLCELGDCEEAVRVFRAAAVQLDHDRKRQAQTIFRTAEVLADMLGQYKDAARELDVLRKRDPQSALAQTAQKRIMQYMERAD